MANKDSRDPGEPVDLAAERANRPGRKPGVPPKTAAVQNLLGGDAAMAQSRRPEIVSDAAYEVLTRDSRECTANLFLVEDVLAEAGVTDLTPYSYAGDDAQLAPDLFVD